MKNILIVSGHTNINESFANKTILDALAKKFPKAEFDYLDKLYPNYIIDIEAEQKKLSNADIIVLQFPLFWYSFPSIMSKWMEDSFQHGFSHGSTGDKLKGKKLIASFSSGAPEELYHRGAAMGFEIDEFLPAIKTTAALCGMDFAGFVYTGGVSYQSHGDAQKLAIMQKKSLDHAVRLTNLLTSLT